MYYLISASSNKVIRIVCKGLSDYPFNIENLFEGYSVGLSER